MAIYRSKLHNDAFPGRSQEQVVPIGLIYAGIRWDRDYRYGAVPEDEQGVPVLVCRPEETYRPYLSWLADYLSPFTGEPSDEQKGLCKYVSRMVPEDAVLLIGMNAAMYKLDVDAMESWIDDRKLYEAVRLELDEKKRNCPDVQHADVEC